jgi:hypothetical protein
MDAMHVHGAKGDEKTSRERRPELKVNITKVKASHTIHDIQQYNN